MIQRIQLAFVLCLLSVAGCRNFIQISENRYVPKNPADSLGPIDYSDTDLLDFNAVYYRISERDSRKIFVYYRFWPTGHVLARSSEQLSRSDVEDFSYASLGFFRLEGNNLLIERFVPDSGRMMWDYVRIFGFIEDDSIVITSATLGRQSWTDNENVVFTKCTIEGLERKPDW